MQHSETNHSHTHTHTHTVPCCPHNPPSASSGDLFAVCLEKREPRLQVVIADSCGDQVIVSVPTKTKSEFAFLPKGDSILGSKGSAIQEPIRRWEGVFKSVEEYLKLREGHCFPMPAVSAHAHAHTHAHTHVHVLDTHMHTHRRMCHFLSTKYQSTNVLCGRHIC